ncbi:hypothetical protein DXM27_03530 [Rhizobium rhizogenes]|uniref:Uncharacterized protein n=2 Tax=Rhizobium/Agrobacterium group TaxID=227290 RepID=A0AA88JUS6_RHIRH|nr:hypothetical protein DXM27_03530 [Rhizobium rhizogenes]MQB09018.1 hypothetical protein [Agrobacterium sp. ICMP 6402]
MRLAPDYDRQTGRHLMTQTNNLYLIIGALMVVLVGLGAYVWHEESKPKGIEMNIGPNGVSVQEN